MITRGSRPILLVNRATRTSGGGDVYLTTYKNGFYEIDAWYSDGRCRTTGGDVWSVKRYSGPDADYIVDEAVSSNG